MNQDHGRRCVTIGVAIFLGCVSLNARAEERAPAQRARAWLGTVSLPAKNYVQDGSFELGERWAWFQHKTGGVESGSAVTGKNAFHMVGNDPNRYFYYNQSDVPLETGKTYTLSAWVKAKGVSRWGSDHMSSGAIFLTNYGWTNSVTLKPSGPTFGWTRLTQTFTAMATKPRADGKPSYTLTLFWPPKTEGEFWLDDVQIEEGSKATAFTDVYVGDGLVAREKLQDLAVRLFATQAALEKFGTGPLIRQLSGQIDGILADAGKIRDDLKRFKALAKSDRAELSKRVEVLGTRLAGVRTVLWMGPAHIMLSEVQMPPARSEKLGIDETCLKGEHRDIALNIANLTTDGYPVRLAVSELYSEARAERIPVSRWIKLYSVPAMRGFSKPGEVFTDALPELDNGQIVQVNPAAISQTVLSIDTAGLLPGEYTGSITVVSLVDAAGKTQIPVKLTVLPQAILPLDKVDIVECFGHTEYSWDAMMELGVNTFDISSAWIDSEFDDSGHLTSIDFSRVDRDIRRALAAVPTARFLCLGGQGLWSWLEARYGWKATEPRFEVAFKAWVKALVDHLGTLGVAPSRLAMETFDEPGEGDYAAGTKMAGWIRAAAPGVLPHFYVTGIGKDDGWKNNALAHGLIGPIVGACTPENTAFLKTLGKKLWVYDCAADGESFEPIAYYRLMPWMCRKYGISGWGHFSWFSSTHGFGRGYRPWEGVETQNLVYPGPSNEGFVISRRFLALRAGHEDYQVLDALDRAMTDPKADPQRVAEAKKFLAGIYDRALSMSPRETGYQTHLAKGVAPDLLDQLRRQAVACVAALLPASSALDTALQVSESKTTLCVVAPEDGKLTVRYLVDGQLPWRVQEQKVAAGEKMIRLAEAGDVNRCLVEFVGTDGRVLVGVPMLIPHITVDSTSEPYGMLVLNDGVRVPAVKFEPESAWISGSKPVMHWVELDLGQARRISQVRLFWMTFTGRPQKTMVQYADASGAWKPVSATPDFRPASAPVEDLRFSPVTTRKLRVVMAPNGGGRGGPALMGLSEVEVQ